MAEVGAFGQEVGYTEYGFMSGLEGAVMAEWRNRSRQAAYRTDPVLWAREVLDRRLWSKQRDIANSFAHNTFTIVKSCNGVGKSDLAAILVCWFASVHIAQQTRVLISAPVREQIDTVIFQYIRDFHAAAKENGTPLPGRLTRWPKWVVDEPYPVDLVQPKRPADENLVSSFQGIHAEHVAVFLDEAGGLPEDLFTAANAVTTNEHVRILAIGNPDRLNTGFHDRFRDPEKFPDWHRFTISAAQSPNFTGETIHEDPEQDRIIKSKLVQVEWAEMMRRSSAPSVVKAKVDGEFPDSDDDTFFPQTVIDRAQNTEIEILEDGSQPRRLGVDLAFTGTDKCAAYLNVGGRIRIVDEWNRDDGTEVLESARRIHALAILYGVHELRVDSAGTGLGVFQLLRALEEFENRTYVLIGIVGAKSAPNPAQYLNARAWHYAQFRDGMVDGLIDLDHGDKELKDELVRQPYKLTNASQVQMLPKPEMRKLGIKSPDHLDAAIYSYVDMSDEVDSPAAGMQPGDTLMYDPWAVADVTPAGLPM